MSVTVAALSGPMADAMKRNRESFNAKFALARRGGARIDSQSFLAFLAAVVDPIISQVSRHFAEKVDSSTAALYELSLELFAQSLLGPLAHEPAIADAWKTLLPAVPRLLARDPRRVAASITNAVHQIGQTSGARPNEWISAMTAIGQYCDDMPTFLDAGKVAGWLAGCPQYRKSALEIASSLPLPVSVSLFGLDPATSAAAMKKTVDAMSANRWLKAGETLPTPIPARIRIVGQTGGFRGFGGPFLRPPIVSLQNNRILASDGESVWAMIADAYGGIFHRVNAGTITPGKLSGPVELSAACDVRWGGTTAKMPELFGWKTASFDGNTLAVTLVHSHLIFLIALK